MKNGLIDVPVEAQERMYAIYDEFDKISREYTRLGIRENSLKDEAAGLLREYPTIHFRRETGRVVHLMRLK